MEAGEPQEDEMEDISDAAFIKRHYVFETQEIERYNIGLLQKKTTNGKMVAAPISKEPHNDSSFDVPSTASYKRQRPEDRSLSTEKQVECSKRLKIDEIDLQTNLIPKSEDAYFVYREES